MFLVVVTYCLTVRRPPQVFKLIVVTHCLAVKRPPQVFKLSCCCHSLPHGDSDRSAWLDVTCDVRTTGGTVGDFKRRGLSVSLSRQCPSHVSNPLAVSSQLLLSLPLLRRPCDGGHFSRLIRLTSPPRAGAGCSRVEFLIVLWDVAAWTVTALTDVAFSGLRQLALFDVQRQT